MVDSCAPKNVPDPRFASRKWLLVCRLTRLYTVIHLINAAMLLFARHNNYLDGELLKSLWFTSLSTWSIGVITVAGWYMKINVDQKKLLDGIKD